MNRPRRRSDLATERRETGLYVFIVGLLIASGFYWALLALTWVFGTKQVAWFGTPAIVVVTIAAWVRCVVIAHSIERLRERGLADWWAAAWTGLKFALPFILTLVVWIEWVYGRGSLMILAVAPLIFGLLFITITFGPMFSGRRWLRPSERPQPSAQAQADAGGAPPSAPVGALEDFPKARPYKSPPWEKPPAGD